MKKYLAAYLLTVPILLALDLIWIGYFMSDFYRSNLGHLLMSGVSFAPAIAFYLLYAAGIFFFAVRPALEKNSIKHAGALGLMLGLVAYGTYDLTNQATMVNWPPMVSVVDMIWGAALTAAIAKIGFMFVKKFNKKHHD